MTTTTSADNEALKTLSRLKVSPKIAWPTVTLMVASHLANILSWVMVLNGLWPAWVGLIVVSIAGYVMCTCVTTVSPTTRTKTRITGWPAACGPCRCGAFGLSFT